MLGDGLLLASMVTCLPAACVLSQNRLWWGLTLTLGFFSFMYRPAPVMVPPVPTPHTSTSTCIAVEFIPPTLALHEWHVVIDGVWCCKVAMGSCGLSVLHARCRHSVLHARCRHEHF